jgi:hypothetical protein
MRDKTRYDDTQVTTTKKGGGGGNFTGYIGAQAFWKSFHEFLSLSGPLV